MMAALGIIGIGKGDQPETAVSETSAICRSTIECVLPIRPAPTTPMRSCCMRGWLTHEMAARERRGTGSE